jgi:hypothetical protein
MTASDPDAGHERIHVQRGEKFYRRSGYVAANISDCSCGDRNCVWIRNPDKVTWRRCQFGKADPGFTSP